MMVTSKKYNKMFIKYVGIFHLNVVRLGIEVYKKKIKRQNFRTDVLLRSELVKHDADY